MNVLVRTDASARIGSGHAMRCAALGDWLRRKGARVTFVMREVSPTLEEWLRGKGHLTVKLPEAIAPRAAGWLAAHWETDAAQTLQVLDSQQPADWLVVDHYGIDYRWEERVRRASVKLLVIDDLATSRHDCDALLNQNLVANARERYRTLVSGDCRLLLGPKFALLREEFRAARAGLQRDAQRVRKLLVFLGGGDPHGVTLQVLSVVAQIKPDEVAVDVVVGAENPHYGEIEKHYGAKPGYRIIVQAMDIPRLMLGADLAIGAGGVSTWERCCLGLPSVVLAIAENQEEVSRAAAEAGACLFLGRSTEVTAEALAAALSTVLGNVSLRRLLSESGRKLVDGAGGERVARMLLQRSLRVRPARLEDGERLFAWRNAEATRRHSHDAAPLNFEGHLQWLRNCLKDSSRALLIGEDDATPVGALRYDLGRADAMVSIYLDPELHGRGYGPRLLLAGETWLRTARLEIRSVRAEMSVANEASRSAFEEAGFRMRGYLFGKDLDAGRGIEARAP
jgi:UDP-2,4-diacetamido-2,4,6-trideoxy-beta-L-altropyranose hydrolase